MTSSCVASDASEPYKQCSAMDDSLVWSLTRRCGLSRRRVHSGSPTPRSCERGNDECEWRASLWDLCEVRNAYLRNVYLEIGCFRPLASIFGAR